jgi:hypothetical protein
VSLHPVAVILSVAAGSYLAGIPGALFSVPILAVANSAIRYIAARTWEHEQVLVTPEGPVTLGPDTDDTIREVRPPDVRSFRGEEAAASTDASNPEGKA